MNPDNPNFRDFDHPCKNTCSGWKQGFDKGAEKVAELQAKLDKAVEALKVAHQVIMITHPELSDIEMNTLTIRQHDVWRHYQDVLIELTQSEEK